MVVLGEATWPGVSDCLLVVPVGSLEQHGPHLPLDTDARIVGALARDLAAGRPGSALAPLVPYGASGEHEDFPGTVSVGRPALTRYLIELGRSAGRTFGRTLLVNWHGGNTDALEHAVAALREEGREVRLWNGTAPAGDAHAGRIETSLLLALSPDVVRRDRAEAGNTAPLRTLWPRLRTAGVRAVSDNGVLGDPAGASAEEGHALYRTLLDDLGCAAAGWWPWWPWRP